MDTVKRNIAAAIACILILVAGFGSASAYAYASETKTMPVVFIVVGFEGDGTTQPVPYDEELNWSDTIFGADNSLASYYLDMSAGAFTFAPASEISEYGRGGNYNFADSAEDGVIHVTLPRPHGRWATVNEDRAVAREFADVVMDALETAGDSIDFASFDTNVDSVISPDELAVCICISGFEASALDSYQTSDLPLMWSHAGLLSILGKSERTAKGLEFNSYIALAEYYWPADDPLAEVEQEPLGVLYHELGHYLGLPDLYSVESPAVESDVWSQYQVRTLSLMDTGGWAYIQGEYDWEYAPAALDAWSRYVLNWTFPTVITQTGDYVVSSQLSENGYSTLLVPTPIPDEFYLIENRQPDGHDASIPTAYPQEHGGIVVWHIDKGTYRANNLDNSVNSANHHPAIMELFFEADESPNTAGWPCSTPNIDRPFFDLATTQTPEGNLSIELPLYAPANTPDTPQSCMPSGIRLSFPSASSPTMTVHVEMPDYDQESETAYPLENGIAEQLGQSGSALASLACSALLYETDADIALIDAGSFSHGINAGLLSWSDAYGILKGKTHISTYLLTGDEITNILEHSLAVCASLRNAPNTSSSSATSSVPSSSQSANPTSHLSAAGAEALAFAGLEGSVDWGNPDGSRLLNPTVNGRALDSRALYRVVVTNSVAELPSYPAFSQNAPEITMLWGDAGDAIRSFIQNPGWEHTAEKALSDIAYVEPKPAETPFAFAQEIPLLPIVIAGGALLIIVIGALVTARRRRQ